MKATKVNAGLAESNGRLLLGIWRDSLHVTCGLTACTPGSAPGQTLSNEYGKTLPFFTCGKRHKTVECPSVRLSVPSIDSSSGGQRICCWDRARARSGYRSVDAAAAARHAGRVNFGPTARWSNINCSKLFRNFVLPGIQVRYWSLTSLNITHMISDARNPTHRIAFADSSWHAYSPRQMAESCMKPPIYVRWPCDASLSRCRFLTDGPPTAAVAHRWRMLIGWTVTPGVHEFTATWRR